MNMVIPDPCKLKVIVFFSGSASSWRYLRDHDPDYGVTYEIVAGFCDDNRASALQDFQKAKIPVFVRDFKQWRDTRRSKKRVRLSDINARNTFFAPPLESLSRYEADIIMLSGFMRILPSSVLRAYPKGILNVHPADVRIVDGTGARKYIGDDAVTLALADGAKETRSSILLVTDEVDNGPILVVSAPLPVLPGRSAKEHQDEMKFRCDGPAYAAALGYIAMILSVDPESSICPPTPIEIEYLEPTLP